MVIGKGSGVQSDGIGSRKGRHKGTRLIMGTLHDFSKCIVLVK